MAQTSKMSQRFKRMSRVFPLIFDPRTPVLFLIGLVLTEILGSSTYDVLMYWWGDSIWASFGAMLGSAALLAGVVFVLISVVGRHAEDDGGLGTEKSAEKREGLVVFLSPGRGKADEEALKFHDENLRFIRLIETREVEKEGKGQQLVEAYTHGQIVPRIRQLNNPFDAEEAYHVVSSALDEAAREGLSPGQLYVDITGCPRPAAVGATLACWEKGHDLEYVFAKYDNGVLVPETSQVMQVALNTTNQDEGKT